MDLDGWHPDPVGVHEERLFRDGQPTALVRNSGIGSLDAPATRWRPTPGGPRTVGRSSVESHTRGTASAAQGSLVGTLWHPGARTPIEDHSDHGKVDKHSTQPWLSMAALLVVVGVLIGVIQIADGGSGNRNAQSATTLNSVAGQLPDQTLTSLERALKKLPRDAKLNRIEQELEALPPNTTVTTLVHALEALPPSTTVTTLERALKALPRVANPTASSPRGTSAPPRTSPTQVTQSAPRPLPGPTPATVSTSAVPATTTTPHIMVVMMENKNLGEVIGQSDQPYTNSLATTYGLATQSYAFGHPSLPNYLDMVSGSNQGVTDDNPPSSHSFPGALTLADQLATAGISERAYAENLPANPTNDSGEYAVRHVPWEYFPNTRITVVDASSLTSDLNGASPPAFVWYTPNLISDEHDGTPQQGDAFLSSFIPSVQATNWYKTGGQIIITWDEADTDNTGINGGGGGHVPTIVVSAALKANPQQYAGSVDTTGVLHSIEDIYRVGHLGGSSSDGTIDALLSPS